VTGRLRRNEHGQAVLITILFLTVLLGASALTLDIGVFYREQRQAQSTADAAALAGAQALPLDPTRARALALQYATNNGGGVAGKDITLKNGYVPNDTVVVKATRNSDGFFAKIWDIASVDVHATAAARADVPQQVNGVAPIVNKLHPMLSGAGCPCFRAETTIPLAKTGAPGAFGMVDLDGGSNGNPDLANWITDGFDGYLDLGLYQSDPGANFNSNNVRSALQSRVGTELLFPVFDTLTGSGANAVYNVIGWVAFHLDCVGLKTTDTDCVSKQGNNQSLTGYFTRVIWDGLQSSTNKNLPDFGVYSVALVN
jgi:Flp pilus assembly protein TadG